MAARFEEPDHVIAHLRRVHDEGVQGRHLDCLRGIPAGGFGQAENHIVGLHAEGQPGGARAGNARIDPGWNRWHRQFLHERVLCQQLSHFAHQPLVGPEPRKEPGGLAGKYRRRQEYTGGWRPVFQLAERRADDHRPQGMAHQRVVRRVDPALDQLHQACGRPLQGFKRRGIAKQDRMVAGPSQAPAQPQHGERGSSHAMNENQIHRFV